MKGKRLGVKRVKVLTIGMAESLGANVAETIRCVIGEKYANIYIVRGAVCPQECTCLSGDPYPETPCPMRWIGGKDGCVFVCEGKDRECIRAIKEKTRTSS